MVYIVLKESYNKEAGVGSTIEMEIVNTSHWEMIQHERANFQCTR